MTVFVHDSDLRTGMNHSAFPVEFLPLPTARLSLKLKPRFVSLSPALVSIAIFENQIFYK